MFRRRGTIHLFSRRWVHAHVKKLGALYLQPLCSSHQFEPPIRWKYAPPIQPAARLIRVALVFIGVHPGASVMGIWGSCSPVVVFTRISVQESMTQMMRGVDENSPLEAVDFGLFVFRLDLSWFGRTVGYNFGFFKWIQAYNLQSSKWGT